MAESRFKKKYHDRVVPALRQKFGYKNIMAVPRLEKIVISMGLGKAIDEKKRMETASKELALISGQKPLVCKAKKSVSNFKLRQGMDIGLKVTLRHRRMYEFMDRLVSVTIPRVRDFRGLPPKGFDRSGNYTLGLSEQTVFPEIDPDKAEFQQGMNITLVTSAKTDEEGRELLAQLGMPFRER